MSKSSKTNFGNSLAKLEEVVEAMEEESLPLEDLIKYYQKGSDLIKECETSLKAAHKQLETIRVKSQQKTTSTPSVTEDNPDDEIRLF